MTLNESDYVHILRTARNLVIGSLDCPHCREGCTAEELAPYGGRTVCLSDCYSSETVALSIGYAEVWKDGAVVTNGQEIADVGDEI